jgi:hypothetical protein
LRQQPLEAWTGDAAARSSEIVVDDLNSRPAKLLGAIGKPILSSLAFQDCARADPGLIDGFNRPTHAVLRWKVSNGTAGIAPTLTQQPSL